MDGIERLECVYYSGPIPSNSAVLTALCFVFDKIHFPGVYLPQGDYDKELLRHEIARLEALDDNSYETHELIGTLRFLEYRTPLDGILEYPTPSGAIFGMDKDEVRNKLVRRIYDANYPPRENFEPMFTSASVKGLPESKEAVEVAGEFHYQAGAILYAEEKQLPLLDDGSGLALPFRGKYKDNAQALAALLAIESVSLGLPELPILSPQALVDFRMENTQELQNFRTSMLRYAKTLNAALAEDATSEELNRKAKFIVETEINPALHDLNRDLNNPNRSWYNRSADGVKILSSVILGVLSGGLVGKTAAEGIKSGIVKELESRGDKIEAAKRNGLYYLLKAKKIGS
jgi:hypothetical protein